MQSHGLKTSKYLQTPEGRYSRYIWRKRHGYRYYSFDREPPGKATKEFQKAEFQKEILAKMKENNHRAYTSKIALQISLNPSTRNPPHVHTSMKKLLDIFQEPLPESRIKRKSLLIQDDNQIAYLSVRHHLGTGEKKIRTTFSSFTNFLENLKLAEDILSGSYNHSFDRIEFEREINGIGSLYERPSFSETMDELGALERDKKRYIGQFGKKAYESMHLMHKMEAQEKLLNMSKLKIQELYNVFNASGIFKEKPLIKKLAEVMARWVTASPIRMELPPLPTQDNQKEAYKNLIKQNMETFRNQFNILKPLYIPVIMQVIYKPPITSHDFYKDLDNILRDFLLPAFHKEFEPPPTHVSILRDSIYPIDDRLKEMINKIPKSIQHSVAGYEIIEIPRQLEDEEDGFLVIAISSGSSLISSLWHEIDKIIDTWEECWDDSLW